MKNSFFLVRYFYHVIIYYIDYRVSVRLGDYDINNDGPDCVKTATNGEDCTDAAISIPIEKFITHPDFEKNNTRQNDITLIRLLRMAPYTGKAFPVHLYLIQDDLSINEIKRQEIFIICP
jgi:hypothetical protein